MKSSIELKNKILNLIKDNIASDDVTVFDAFQRKNVQMPVKKLIISVGVNGEDVTVENLKNVNNTYDNKIVISINMLSPLNSGGKYLSETISNIKELLSSDLDETLFKISASEISHKSNVMAYQAEILVTFFDEDKSVDEDDCEYDNLNFYLNGVRHYASKIKIELDVKHYESKSYGEGKVYKSNLLNKTYIITIFTSKELIVNNYDDSFTINLLYDKDNTKTFENGVFKEYELINRYNKNTYKYTLNFLGSR